jgi:glycosyltransferase involved in cell wall biosynthesis
VREVIRHGQNGLLTDFCDAERMAWAASEVLDHPQDYKHLGRNGVDLIRDRYSLEVCLPRMRQLYEQAIALHGRLDDNRRAR